MKYSYPLAVINCNLNWRLDKIMKNVFNCNYNKITFDYLNKNIYYYLCLAESYSYYN